MTVRIIATVSAFKTQSLEKGKLHFDGWTYFRVTGQENKVLQDEADFSCANFGCRTSISGKFYMGFVGFFFFSQEVLLQQSGIWFTRH